MQQHYCIHSVQGASTERNVKRNFVTTDPALARQITVKDISTFHDRFFPNLGNSLHSGHRHESEQSSMAVAMYHQSY